MVRVAAAVIAAVFKMKDVESSSDVTVPREQWDEIKRADTGWHNAGNNVGKTGAAAKANLETGELVSDYVLHILGLETSTGH